MSIFNRLFPSKEMKMVIRAMKEAENVLNNYSFYIIKNVILKNIYNNPKKVSENLKKSSSTIEWVYSIISNISGDYVESGHYHMYRGMLNSQGQDLLKLFDDSTDELLKMGAIDETFAKEQKNMVRLNIRHVG